MPEPNESDDRALIAAAQAGDEEALGQMALKHDALVKYVAKRFLGRGCELDDLFQLGRLGLVKAVKHFCLDMDVQFSTYAVPLIMGEIRRFLRDDGQVHVARSIRENSAKLMRAMDSETSGELAIEDLARRAQLTREEAILAIGAGRAARSLSEPVNAEGTLLLQDTLGEDRMSEIVERMELQRMLATLPEEERTLIERRYFQEHTQSRIALEMGMTQVQVSRLETRILKRLREMAVS